MEASLAVCTETWFRDSQDLDDDIDDLLHGAGIGMLVLNRGVGDRGVAHGGVAVAYRAATMTTKSVTMLQNPEKYEILTTVSTIAGHSKKLVTIAAYIPPGYPVARGRGCLSFISDLVIEAKRRYREPYLAISGDFNQWDVGQALEDFLDISEVDVGPT